MWYVRMCMYMALTWATKKFVRINTTHKMFGGWYEKLEMMAMIKEAVLKYTMYLNSNEKSMLIKNIR